MNAILNQTIELSSGGHKFVFAVPTPVERARLGLREAGLRRQFDPASGGWPDGMDMDTFNLIRGFAVLQLYLRQTDAEWVYTATDKGEPIVDIDKFPAGKDSVIIELGQEFLPALARFHGEGSKSGRPDIQEAVDRS
jgi:hypothetical protein